VTVYVRKSTRRYKDRTYTNYLLVESVSTPKGPRQRTICSLGDLRPRSREEWLQLARKVEATLAGSQHLFEAPDAEVAEVVARARKSEGTPPDNPVVAVRTAEVAVERPREAGPVHVGHEYWRRLRLDEILGGTGLSPRAVKLACAMTLNRLIAPRSEHAMPEWMRQTALADIVRAPVAKLADDALYRMLDTLHGRRGVIETQLAAREQDLFGLDGTVFFYDLTSTYFEGQALHNPKAMRGYSRDSRPDCKQVVIGLVIGREGFPAAHEVFEGKTQDRQSVEQMLAVLDARVKLSEGQMVVVDRGMAFDENLQAIRARKLHYLVAARQCERDRWLADFEDADFEEILRQPSPNNPAQKKSKVWIARRETEEELHVLCRSEGRIAKDRAIRDKQEARLLADLAKLAKRIDKGRLVKERAIGEAIGRLRERYPRVARYFTIDCDTATRRLTWRRDEAKYAKAERLDGCYLLKTSRKDLRTDEAWRIYITLTRAEEAFRDMKSPLAERPIFHHLEHRVETHIFLCLLAYHLLVAIETTLERRGVFTSWGTVRDALRSHQIVTVVLPTADGGVLRIRKPSTPERQHRELYQLLGIPAEIIRPRHTWSRPNTAENSD
jgi:transposase